MAVPYYFLVPKHQHVIISISFSPDKSLFSVQKFILGTHTSGEEQNYLMIMKARLPIAEAINSSDIKDNKENPFSKIESKIEIETKINHQGEINKARPMPQIDKYNIIASKTNNGEIHIFDYHKNPPKPVDNSVKPEIKLLGHTKEGYGLSWNTIKSGFLVSGSDDNKVFNLY